MMKKTLIIALLLVGCVVAFCFFKNGSGPSIQIAEVLPADVVFYQEQHDFVEMYQKFKASKLGKAITGIDLVAITGKMGGDVTAAQDATVLLQKIDKTCNEPIFKQMLGQEFGVAFFAGKGFSADKPEQLVKERLLFVARPQYNAKAMEFLATVFAKDLEKSVSKYAKQNITAYKIDENYSLYTTTINDLLLAALDERLLHTTIDIHAGKNATLASTPNFQKLRGRFSDATLFSYFSLESFKEQMDILAEKMSQNEKQAILEVFKQWNGMQVVGYGAWQREGHIEEQVELLYNESELDPYVAKLFGMEPEGNNTLSMVGAKPLLYWWSNGLNLPLFYERSRELVAGKDPHGFDLLQQEVQDRTGMVLEDILALIGNESALIVNDVSTKGVPIPKIAFVLEIEDKEPFLNLLEGLIAEAGIPLQSVSFQAQEIRYWGMSPQEGLQPAFTLFGKYLLVSNARDMIEQMLLVQENEKDNLSNNPDIKSLKDIVAAVNNSTVYLHIARSADALKAVVNWAKGMAAMQGPEVASRVDVLATDLVLPLLDGVSMYSQVACRSEITNENVVVESTILLAP